MAQAKRRDGTVTKPRSTATRPPQSARDRIVSAAVAAFAELGFEAASTREIARRADTDQGLVTYHFPAKLDLWKAAADNLFGELSDMVETSIAEMGDTPGRAREMVRQYVRFSAAHPELFRFMVDAGNRSTDRMRWLADRHVKPRFVEMKQRGIIAEANIDEADAAHAFYALVGAGSLIFAVGPECKRVTGLKPASRAAVEAHADFVARLMVPNR